MPPLESNDGISPREKGIVYVIQGLVIAFTPLLLILLCCLGVIGDELRDDLFSSAMLLLGILYREFLSAVKQE
jgi:hypothetical protein